MWYWILPHITYAADAGYSVKTLIYRISDYILNPIIKIGFVVAVLYFMWGLVEYIMDRNSGHIWQTSVFDKDNKMTTRGADKIIWGLVGLFIMVSAFGIMNLLAGLVGSNIKTP